MQFYSFDVRDPVYAVGSWRLSFQIITLDNVFSLDLARTTVAQTENTWSLDCTQLSWAGQQARADGWLSARGTLDESGRLKLKVAARAPSKIRAIKILLRSLPPLTVLDMLDSPRTVPEDGLLERYPNNLRMPALFVNLPDGRTMGFRSEDEQMRAKRFAVYQERGGAGGYIVECIHEEDARHFENQMDVPVWIFAPDTQPETFRAEQLLFYEVQGDLKPWDQRQDMPDWTRDVHLVLTLHGMHWSGYVFNTYQKMLDTIRFVTNRIEGRHVLAYLPGWEGRYYWQYGDFRPDPRLGGVEAFTRLCDSARALGVHVMPMFGGNCANAWAENFHAFGPSSYMKSPTRNPFLGNQPDWDTSRAHDTGWQAWLNPGAPAWQNELSRQILTLVDTYGFDAVFLDTVEVWVNDPDFNLREGYRQLVNRLRHGRPDLLVTGEDWWDGLLAIFPIFQQSGKWRQVPDWGGRYVRYMGHICDGEPWRGSTGVFESGYAPYERLPDKPFYLPTLAFVDGTLENARDEIEAVITIAKQRAAQQT